MSALALAGAVRGRGPALRLLRRYGVYAALAVLFLAAVVLDSGFLSAGNVRIQLFQVAPTLLVALGMALVIGTEGIDLSVGAVIALAAAVVPLYIGWGLPVAVVTAVALGAVSGLAGGAMVAFTRVQPIVATLALMIGVRGVASLVNGASAKPVTDPALLRLGSEAFAGVPWTAWLAAGCVALTAVLVHRTTFGRQLVAVGDNRRAARLAGLPVRRVLLTVYLLSGCWRRWRGADHRPRRGGRPGQPGPQHRTGRDHRGGGRADAAGRRSVRVLGTVAGALFMQLITAVLTQHDVHSSITKIVEAAVICLAVYASQERGTR
ncbi:ABC transporter permease [Kitasatospora fiedleri]|uniref:ABC transporter permease n=1 Tax=Kitasatospora fiedleri TaxID=2991545 RepID=UPI00249B1445|nr:ABC transporter permease [Kitasatospora fiedleri]